MTHIEKKALSSMQSSIDPKEDTSKSGNTNPQGASFIDETLPWANRDRLKSSKAMLVGVYKAKPEESIAQEHIEELSLLAKTHKIEVVDTVLLQVREFSAATFISKGKVDSLCERAQEKGCNLIIFDDEISPAQQRNLESELKLPVIDRREVILGVFADRARSHEAKLQVELARIQYMYPRLKRMWTHLSRQSGGGGGSSGGGYLKGEGEKQIEIDRRILKRRMGQLADELKEVERYRTTQRALREKNSIPVFGIVGYTNAGKSTLMKKLTGADVLVEDMLFATLDTTTRRLTLPHGQEVLVIDTVGFIRKLPHQLVAAFKSTLEETVHADILIHLIDSSHPNALGQAQTTLEVIKELNTKETPIITVMNKVDLAAGADAASQQSMLQKLKMSYPRAISLSAITGEGLQDLFNEMEVILQRGRVRVQLKIPQSRYDIALDAKKVGILKSEDYEENDIILDIELSKGDADRIASLLKKI